MFVQKLFRFTRKKRAGSLVPTCNPRYFSFQETTKDNAVSHKTTLHVDYTSSSFSHSLELQTHGTKPGI